MVVPPHTPPLERRGTMYLDEILFGQYNDERTPPTPPPPPDRHDAADIRSGRDRGFVAGVARPSRIKKTSIQIRGTLNKRRLSYLWNSVRRAQRSVKSKSRRKQRATHGHIPNDTGLYFPPEGISANSHMYIDDVPQVPRRSYETNKSKLPMPSDAMNHRRQMHYIASDQGLAQNVHRRRKFKGDKFKAGVPVTYMESMRGEEQADINMFPLSSDALCYGQNWYLQRNNNPAEENRFTANSGHAIGRKEQRYRQQIPSREENLMRFSLSAYETDYDRHRDRRKGRRRYIAYKQHQYQKYYSRVPANKNIFGPHFEANRSTKATRRTKIRAMRR
ncbi:uncharacterized protein [Amphiura filiformis]|uniref:uncharacterized protein n=1 Tax=Amphiura filiformis TaxID=82378 RepID=UPI003B227CCD